MSFRKIFIFSFLFAACSVLEDRTQCPSRLHLDLSDSANMGCDSLMLMVSSPLFRRSEVVGKEDFVSDYVMVVPDRNGVYVNALDNAVAGYDRDGAFRIPQGEECPEAYMFSSWCDTSEEEAGEYVRLRKNYCGVSLHFTSENADVYEMEVYGEICGYSITGEPERGNFTFKPEFPDGTFCYFRLPRQVDASLRMGISAPDGSERYFALGNYIEESGYDWGKEDLDDIVININYASTSVTISINGWKRVEEFPVVI